jgi:hypothetical protein
MLNKATDGLLVEQTEPLTNLLVYVYSSSFVCIYLVLA